MEQVKISVIMPVYNVAPYLREAIDSVLNQTLKEIELICVDDASTDGSTDILKEYEKSDSRVHAVYLTHNSGSVAARKYAVEKACGQYIMMLDSDDAYEPNACETVWREMQRYPTDILCFATNVSACGDIPAEDAANLAKILTPYKGPVKHNLLEAAFKKKQFNQILWNKAFSGSLCKAAFYYIKDVHRTISDDIYISFILYFFAKSYRGISSVLHHYYLGRGVSGHYSMGKKRFFTLSETKTVYRDLYDFLKEQNAEWNLFAFVKQLEEAARDDVVWGFRRSVSAKDAPECYKKMIDDWGVEMILPRLAADEWYTWQTLQKRIIPHSAPVPAVKGKPVRTIGIFYYRMSNGGIERVISLTLPLWQSMGYRVVLITEVPSESNDYAIPNDVERVLIPSRLEAIEGRYATRLEAWKEIAEQYQVDTLVYCAWCDPVLFWDSLAIHGLGLNFISWVHGSYSHLFRLHDANRYALINNYYLVDRAVTLSHTFEAFFKNYCPSFYIPNPIQLPPAEACSSTEGSNIVWVGRFDPEKHPQHAIQAFAKVAQTNPQATLTMVGAGENDQIRKELLALVKELKIEDRVDFSGFIKDPHPYYQKAALFLFTTAHEGFPMVLAEAKGYGLPVVMYALDYLEMVQDSRGVVTVPYGDIDSLANEIDHLLQDSAYRKEAGMAARQSAKDFAEYDFKAAWQAVFNSFETPISSEHLADHSTAKALQLLLQESQYGDQLAAYGNGGVTELTEEQDRLLKSKFAKIARRYWYWKDLILRRIKNILRK